PSLVFGPLDVPPCMRHVSLPRKAHFRHRSFDLLLFAVHCATMIHGGQYDVPLYYFRARKRTIWIKIRRLYILILDRSSHLRKKCGKFALCEIWT
ncbi:MAG: hypothetical protein ACD_17C00194G0001, partial [uncultured bacterium]